MCSLQHRLGLLKNQRLRADFHVIDRRVWFRDRLTDLAHSLEVHSQGVLKISTSLFFGIACGGTAGNVG